MRALLRKLAIRTMLPVSWAFSKTRVSRSLLRFAEVEADSAWQFLRAMEVLELPHQRAAMFHDALEEMEHAAGFHSLARAYAERPLPLCRDRREALLHTPEDLGEFLAYIYEGEREVYGEFEDYCLAIRREDIRAWLQHIREDEAGHQDTALATLVEVLGGEDKLKRPDTPDPLAAAEGVPGEAVHLDRQPVLWPPARHHLPGVRTGVLVGLSTSSPRLSPRQ